MSSKTANLPNLRLLIELQSMDHAEIEAELALSREAARRNGDSGLRVALLKNVEPLVSAFLDRWPTAKELKEVSDQFGVDAASLMVEEIARRIAPNGLFLSEIARQMPLAFRGQAKAIRVEEREAARHSHAGTEICFVESNDSVAVAGSEWGGHVETWRSWVRENGFTTDRIATRHDATVFENAQAIRDHLLESHHSNRILISVGRGSVEVLAALSDLYRGRLSSSERMVPLGVRAWVNVAGPVLSLKEERRSDRTLADRALGKLGQSFRLGRMQFNLPFGARASLLSSARVDLTDAEFARLGNQLTLTSIVGLANLATVPLGTKRKWLDLAEKLGPNDGLYSPLECMAPGGFVVPVAGLSHAAILAGDHSLKPWLLGVLASLEAPGRLATA